MTQTLQCPAPEQWRRFLGGLVADDETVEMERHLHFCAGCLSRLSELAGGDTLVDALRAPTLPPSPAEGQALSRALEQIKGQPPAFLPTNTDLFAPNAEPMPSRLGRSRLLRPLGSGGMGTVYLADAPDFRRSVAVKVPRFGGGEEEQRAARQRFLREARAAAIEEAELFFHGEPFVACSGKAARPAHVKGSAVDSVRRAGRPADAVCGRT